jgi:tetratricopeptide (TPR) repeat protein
VTLVAAVYGQVGAFAFVNLDDQQYVTANPEVLRGLGWDGLAWAFGGFHAANWHPLTWLSHMADVSLFGADAGWHHLVNVALHALNSVLLLSFLRRTTGATWRSAAVAALFAIHPLHVESVAWISERKDVLSGVFFFLALHAWVSYARRPGVLRYLAVAGLLVLGLLAKPMLVTLPFVLLLVDAWPLGRVEGVGASLARRLAPLVVEKLPLLAIAAAASVVTWLAQAAGQTTVALDTVPLAARVANALASYVLYLVRTVWPSGLAAFYPHPALAGGGIPAWKTAGAAVLLAAITALAVRERSRRPYLPWGWLWFLGTLVPVIGLAQVGEQGLADRYTYLPLVGVLVAVAWGASEVVERLRPRRAGVWAAAVLVIAALAGAAFRQVGTWRDSLALHRRALAVTERNWIAWNGLGDALSDAGRPDEAIEAYREALRIRPRLASAWNGLGAAHGMLGAHAQAIAPLEEALRIQPRYADAWYNLGTAYGSAGQHARAAECFRSAVSIRPGDVRAWTNLAIASALARDRRGAAESLQALGRIDPVRARELRARLEASNAP